MLFPSAHWTSFPTTYLNRHCWLAGDRQKAKVPQSLKHSKTPSEPTKPGWGSSFRIHPTRIPTQVTEINSKLFVSIQWQLILCTQRPEPTLSLIISKETKNLP